MANRTFTHAIENVGAIVLQPLPPTRAKVDIKEGVQKFIEFRVLYPGAMPPHELCLELKNKVLTASFRGKTAKDMTGVYVQVVFPRGLTRQVELRGSL